MSDRTQTYHKCRGCNEFLKYDHSIEQWVCPNCKTKYDLKEVD